MQPGLGREGTESGRATEGWEVGWSPWSIRGGNGEQEEASVGAKEAAWEGLKGSWGDVVMAPTKAELS